MQGQDPKSVIWMRYGLLAWIPFLLSVLYRARKIGKLRSRVREENLAEGGIEEAQVFRDLTDLEKERLIGLSKEKGKTDFYLDSRSPVFRIQGSALSEVIFYQDGKPHNALHIRGKTFAGDELEQVKNILSSIKEDKEYAVEYSPRTKHVWKIYKTEDI